MKASILNTELILNTVLILQVLLILLLVVNFCALYLIYNREEKKTFSKDILSILKKWNRRIKSFLKIQKKETRNSIIIKTILQDVNYFSMFILDTDYNYTFINNRHKQDLIQGFNLEVSKGDSIIDLMEKHKDLCKITYIEEFKENIDRGFKGEAFTVFQKIGILDREHYFMMEYVPIKHKNEPISEVLIILLGATEYIQLHRDMVKAKQDEEILHSEKSRFVAYISHELRTTMNAVIGLSNLLLKSDLNIKQNTYLNIINDSGKYLLSVLNDVLDLSKLESGNFTLYSKTFNLNVLIQSIDDIFFIQKSEKDIHINYHINKHIPNVLIGDDIHLKQILINLISNALKFTQKGEVQVNIDIKETNIDFMKKETILLKFEVIDSGIGIKEKYINSIFDKYTQIEDFDRKSSVKGTGLGLAVVKKLTEAMNGTISVTSKENVGTKFAFTLQFDVKKEDQQVNLSIHNQCKTKNIVSILVAEDEEVNKIIISACLQSQGWSFLIVENGKEVLKELASNKYDLILMDIHMPVMNGIETIKKIKKNKQWVHIPIIALTAQTLDEYNKNLQTVEFDNYLTKPVEEKELISMIEKILDLPNKRQILLEESNIENGFKRIEKILEGDKKLVVQLAKKVATMFSEENLCALEKAIHENNILELQELVHKAKGAVLNFQLKSVANLLDGLIQTSTFDDKRKSVKILQELNKQMIAFKQKIEEYDKKIIV